ncbi:hypothetical protein BC831DRAFT_78888 [Entophlyctis helioformis]|nr:hypothetical protein BC831DRAFT_78888 [Entophlyctis helioformis]
MPVSAPRATLSACWIVDTLSRAIAVSRRSTVAATTAAGMAGVSRYLLAACCSAAAALSRIAVYCSMHTTRQCQVPSVRQPSHGKKDKKHVCPSLTLVSSTDTNRPSSTSPTRDRRQRLPAPCQAPWISRPALLAGCSTLVRPGSWQEFLAARHSVCLLAHHARNVSVPASQASQQTRQPGQTQPDTANQTARPDTANQPTYAVHQHSTAGSRDRAP